MQRIYSFPPIADQNSRILILGSMPGVESLRKQQYYAHPQNQFWKIIYDLFATPLEQDYEKKVDFLRSKGIALWDVIENCYREGSSDAKIKEEKPNAIPKLLEQYPRIKCLLFNGTKAYDSYRKMIGFTEGWLYEKLESTSPANTKSYEFKLKNWRKILKYLSV